MNPLKGLIHSTIYPTPEVGLSSIEPSKTEKKAEQKSEAAPKDRVEISSKDEKKSLREIFKKHFKPGVIIPAASDAAQGAVIASGTGAVKWLGKIIGPRVAANIAGIGIGIGAIELTEGIGYSDNKKVVKGILDMGIGGVALAAASGLVAAPVALGIYGAAFGGRMIYDYITSKKEAKALAEMKQNFAQDIAPRMSDRQMESISRFVNESNSAAGVELKQAAIDRMLKINPHLKPEVIDSMADMVNESNSLEGRAIKLDYLVDYLKINPKLSSVQVEGIAYIVNGSNSIEGREMKLESMKHLLSLNKQLDGRSLYAIGRFVNESNSLEGVELKLNGLERLYKNNRKLTPAQIFRVTDYVNCGETLGERQVRMDFMVEKLKNNPHIM
ncbi:MAG: hypothetical protein M1269_10860 [Chloroflexi bacterium]|nr:hypothetical protein [Chloroflexota bacterium]